MIRMIVLLLMSFQAHAFTVFSKANLNQCSIAKLDRDNFSICLQGSASKPDFERAKKYAMKSTVAWLRVLKAYDNTITSNIYYSCENPSLTIVLKNGSGRSYAVPGKTWIYNEVPYATWVHELGHAFVGLGDTYKNAKAGDCRTGQPQSIMCWGGYGPRSDYERFSTLWADDIEGAIHNLRTLRGATLPSWTPADFSLYRAFDLDDAMPGDEKLTMAFSDAEVQVDLDGTLTPINPDAEFE